MKLFLLICISLFLGSACKPAECGEVKTKSQALMTALNGTDMSDIATKAEALSHLGSAKGDIGIVGFRAKQLQDAATKMQAPATAPEDSTKAIKDFESAKSGFVSAHENAMKTCN